ncbi:MAG: SDR family NAD(P)-dependent oxidoreductase [Anaerolineales bacterium]|nr:SDR family NAD(P)-dependent oxidoreductase [Anaerolineales bacterium]
MKVNGKVFVVTGAGSGMGRELTLNLLSKGAKVFGVDMNEKTLQETAQLAGDRKNDLATAVLNVTDQPAVESLPAKVIERFGAVDGLINNAGIIQPFVKFKDLNFEAIERVLHVNLYGVLYMTKAFLPHLLARPAAHIANTSSMGGYLPVPGQTIYGASKAAVKLFTEGLYAELLDTNVKVTLIYPGAIGTNITANSGVAMPGGEPSAKESKFKMLPADQAAEIIVRAMEQDRYHVFVGSDAKFMDFLRRLNAKMATQFIYNQMKSLLK